MINLYITIGLILALPITIIGFIVEGGKSPGIALFMGLMIGMMWPMLIILWVIECYTDSD